MLNNRIIRYPGIGLRNAIERNAEAQEAEHFVQEGAVGG